MSAGHDDYSTLFSNRILRHYDKYLKLAAGGITYPVMAAVHPTYGCELNCLGCEYWEINRQGFIALDFSVYEKFIRSFAKHGGLAVDFSGGGMPMLHPNIVDMLNLAHSLGLSIGVLTSGIWFDDEITRTLVKTASYVRFSLDSATPEMFEKTKRPKGDYKFEHILRNVRELLNIRGEVGRSLTVEVSLKFLVNRVNRGEVREFLRLGESLGVDRVMYKALRNSKYSLAERDLKKVEQELKAHIDKLDPPFRTGVWLAHRGVPKHCVVNSLVAVVDAKADMYLCAYYLKRAKEHWIGNLKRKSFDSIWGSRYHRKKRAAIDWRECSMFDCHLALYQIYLEKLEKSNIREVLAFL